MQTVKQKAPVSKITSKFTKSEAVAYLKSKQNKYIDWDSYAKFQCYDLANAYWNKLFNHSLHGDYAKNIHIDNVKELSKESKIILFDGSVKPEEGDMLIFDYKNGSVAGHVAACLKGGTNGMTIIEQNFDGSGNMPCTVRTCNFFGLIAIVRPNFK